MPSYPNKSPHLVFIVEDNTMYAKTLQIFLKTRFPLTEVLIFPDGEQALSNLYKGPEFIVVDYYLNSDNQKAADGLTILKNIKAQDPGIKLFALSAQQDIKVALAVKEAGCLYLVKNDDTFKNLEELIIRDIQ